jgi:hypothetical protein
VQVLTKAGDEALLLQRRRRGRKRERVGSLRRVGDDVRRADRLQTEEVAGTKDALRQQQRRCESDARPNQETQQRPEPTVARQVDDP